MDQLTVVLAKRLRNISSEKYFADSTMQKVIAATSVEDLSNSDLFKIRESWWRYHLTQWLESDDSILADLADRLVNRRLFKTIPTTKFSHKQLANIPNIVKDAGLDPEYYYCEISSIDRFVSDSKQSIKVLKEDGQSCPLKDMDTMFQTILQHSREISKNWIAVPEEVKALL